jgi:hypothetical protein
VQILLTRMTQMSAAMCMRSETAGALVAADRGPVEEHANSSASYGTPDSSCAASNFFARFRRVFNGVAASKHARATAQHQTRDQLFSLMPDAQVATRDHNACARPPAYAARMYARGSEKTSG